MMLLFPSSVNFQVWVRKIAHLSSNPLSTLTPTPPSTYSHTFQIFFKRVICQTAEAKGRWEQSSSSWRTFCISFLTPSSVELSSDFSLLRMSTMSCSVVFRCTSVLRVFTSFCSSLYFSLISSSVFFASSAAVCTQIARGVERWQLDGWLWGWPCCYCLCKHCCLLYKHCCWLYKHCCCQ